MKPIRTLIGMACVLVLPQIALGLGIPPSNCEFAGYATVTPARPTSDDQIGLAVFVPSSNAVQSFHVYDYYWAKVEAVDRSTFAVDLILTDDAAASFAGYTLVGKNLPAWVFIGPLPPGYYTILGSVNVYDPASGAVEPECDPAIWPSSRATSFAIYPTDSDFQSALGVAEFYNASLRRYFMTMNLFEAQWLDSGIIPGWQRTGQIFLAYYGGPVPGPYSVLRYYGLPSAGLDSHFFTFNNDEATSLSSAWVLEGVAFQILRPSSETGLCPPGALPVYRLWDGLPDGSHRYTIDRNIRQDMIAQGWISEGYGPDGVVMCAPPS